MNNQEFGKAIEEFNSTANPELKGGAIVPFFSDKVLSLADDLFSQLITVIEESPEAKALTTPERAALYISLADAFNDTTDD